MSSGSSLSFKLATAASAVSFKTLSVVSGFSLNFAPTACLAALVTVIKLLVRVRIALKSPRPFSLELSHVSGSKYGVGNGLAPHASCGRDASYIAPISSGVGSFFAASMLFGLI